MSVESCPLEIVLFARRPQSKDTNDLRQRPHFPMNSRGDVDKGKSLIFQCVRTTVKCLIFFVATQRQGLLRPLDSYEILIFGINKPLCL